MNDLLWLLMKQICQKSYTEYMQNKMEHSHVWRYWFSVFFWFFYFYFQSKLRFHEIDNCVEKVVIDEEEFDYLELDDIFNLENLPRTMFID